MGMKVMDAGSVLRAIATMKVQDGSVLRRIIRMKVMDADGTTLRTVATFVQPLTLAISPSEGGGQGYNGGGNPTTVTSGAETATPSGGLGPYTYAWTQLSGDTMTIGSASSATTTLTAVVASGVPKQGVFRCTCSDSSGQTATADVTITLINTQIA